VRGLKVCQSLLWQLGRIQVLYRCISLPQHSATKTARPFGWRPLLRLCWSHNDLHRSEKEKLILDMRAGGKGRYIFRLVEDRLVPLPALVRLKLNLLRLHLTVMTVLAFRIILVHHNPILFFQCLFLLHALQQRFSFGLLQLFSAWILPLGRAYNVGLAPGQKMVSANKQLQKTAGKIPCVHNSNEVDC